MSPLHVARKTTWVNWHQSVTQEVDQLVDVWNAEPNVATIGGYNAATAELQGLVRQAQQNGLGLRAVGGGWSFTPVAATDGILVNTRPLNYQFRLADGNLDPGSSYRGRADNLVFAQCGVSIAELSTALLARGKSLRTSGASNGQTIAGAISCGTHGSAIDVGAVHDLVVALHIVTAPDRHVWLERATAPVAADSLVSAVGAELVRDDALFDAALVSFGSFGLIHGVVLEVDDLFYLQEYRKRYPDGPGVWAAIEQLDFSQLPLPRPGVRPYFLQAIFNPHDRAGGPYLSVMYRDAARPAGPAPDHHGKWRPGDGAAELVGAASDLVSELTPTAEALLLGQLYPDVDGVCGTWGEMFWDTPFRGKLASTAMGIPLDRAREATAVLFELNAKHTIPGFFAIRIVKASRAVLAFTRHQERTCVLEADGTASRRMTDFYREAWDAIPARGIPCTYHWGKMQPFGPDRLVTMYGQASVDAWKAARATLLPAPALREVFANRLIKDLRLHA